MWLFSSTFTNLEKSLDYSMLRHKTIVNNIANVDTPNYKTKDVTRTFSDELNRSLQAFKNDVKHIDFSTTASSEPTIKQRSSTFTNNNGNNVDIDQEMVEFAENQIYYYNMIDRIGGKFNSLTTVIKGGK